MGHTYGVHMTVKFIQYWDVLSEQEEEFRNFVVKSYIPGVNETGFLKIVESWNVATGEGPYYIMEGVAESVKSVNDLLQLDEFQKLNHLLHFLITNYKSKLLVPTGPIVSVVPEHKNYRFNHHYDVIHEKYDDYIQFLQNEHIPTMEAIGVNVIGGWYAAIGPGPNIVIEGSCPSIRKILEAIATNRYRELISKLLTMVDGFGSKILVANGLVS